MKYSTICEALGAAAADKMAKDFSVLVLGNGVRENGGRLSRGLYSAFGSQRVIDVPPSKDMGCALALGLAQTGAKPIIEIEGEYLLRALDVIANEIAVTEFMYDNQYASSVTIIAYTGFVKNASVQINQAYEAMLIQIPSLEVLCPSNPSDAYDFLTCALESEGPTVLVVEKSLAEYDFNAENISVTHTQDADKPTNNPFEAKRILKGEDVSIITYGSMVKECVAAAKAANIQKGISCDVIDIRSLNPIDYNTIIKSVSATGKVIVAHKARRTGGIASEIAAIIAQSEAFDYLEAPIIRICANDEYTGYADEYYDKCVPDKKDIYSAILKIAE